MECHNFLELKENQYSSTNPNVRVEMDEEEEGGEGGEEGERMRD